MSFRRRLALFFLLIVVVPMIVIALLVSEVATESTSGKTDAALSEDLEFAELRYDELLEKASRAAERIAGDDAVQAALANGDEQLAAQRVDELAGGLPYLRFTNPDGGELASVGSGEPFAEGTASFAQGGSEVAKIIVSKTTADEYLRLVADQTGEEAALVGPSGSVKGSLEVNPSDMPAGREGADVEIAGEEMRLAAVELTDARGTRLVIGAPVDTGGFLASRPGIAAAALAFIILALLAALAITRTLQGQIATMLSAARRIGDGDFTGEVPVVGDDEMAGLAGEFNEMRDRLATQMDQLKRQRVEIESSVNRIGEAVASGLDRQALLEILIETAVGACEAEYGIVALSGRAGAEAETGAASDEIRDVALAVERGALRGAQAIRGERQGTYALSAPLGRLGTDGEPLGAMTVARTSRGFSESEQNVFYYLVGQAAASVENLALHEMVTEQAVTDELTGLPNNRAFRDSIAKEAARAARFRHDLSLLMLDIDDFKAVNDTFGHLQGDAVLRAVGRILDAESRGIDEPARYGGEEFVVALPETAAEGAHELGERIRALIADEPIPRVDGKGKISVTASFGAATMPAAGLDAVALIAAADAALYEAKRAGKNRVVVAEGNGMGWRTDAE